jgi:hypothetical protein
MKQSILKSILFTIVFIFSILILIKLRWYPIDHPIKESFAISMNNQIGTYSYIGYNNVTSSYPLFYGINQGNYGTSIAANIPSNIVTLLTSYFNTFPITTRPNITTFTTSKIVNLAAYYLELDKGFTAYSYSAAINTAGQAYYIRYDEGTVQARPPNARTKSLIYLLLNFYIIIVPNGFPAPPAVLTVTTNDTSAYTGDYQDDIVIIKQNCNKANISGQYVFNDIPPSNATSLASYVSIESISCGSEWLNFSQIVVKDKNGTNISTGRTVYATSNYGQGDSTAYAVDGTESARFTPFIYHSSSGNASFTVKLDAPTEVASVTIYNRISENIWVMGRLGTGYIVTLLDQDGTIFFRSSQLNGGFVQTISTLPPPLLPYTTPAKYVGIRSISIHASWLHISQIVVSDMAGTNVAKGRPVETVGTYVWGGAPTNPVDGVENARAFPSVYHSCSERNGYYMVVLDSPTTISSVTVYNRTDNLARLGTGFAVVLLDENRNVIFESKKLNSDAKQVISINAPTPPPPPATELAKYAGLQSIKSDSLYLAFSQITVKDMYGTNISKGRPVNASPEYYAGGSRRYPVDGTESTREFPYIYNSASGNAFYMITLDIPIKVSSVTIHNRASNTSWISGYSVVLLDEDKNVIYKSDPLAGNPVQTITINTPLPPPSATDIRCNKHCSKYCSLDVNYQLYVKNTKYI